MVGGGCTVSSWWVSRHGYEISAKVEWRIRDAWFAGFGMKKRLTEWLPATGWPHPLTRDRKRGVDGLNLPVILFHSTLLCSFPLMNIPGSFFLLLFRENNYFQVHCSTTTKKKEQLQYNLKIKVKPLSNDVLIVIDEISIATRYSVRCGSHRKRLGVLPKE